MSLVSKFEKFMRTLPSIQAIDDMTLDQDQRRSKIADYMDIEKNIILEQKSITVEQSKKVDNELDKYKDTDAYPLFFWN